MGGSKVHTHVVPSLNFKCTPQAHDIILLCLGFFMLGLLYPARCWSCQVCLGVNMEPSHASLKTRACNLFLDGVCVSSILVKRV